MDQEDDLRDEKIYHHLAAMESHDDFIKEKQMTKDDTGFLWQNLARYKRAKERGHKSAERFLDETYENFGFSEPSCTKRRAGLPHIYYLMTKTLFFVFAETLSHCCVKIGKTV